MTRHGFGAAEFDRAKKWMLAAFERAYTERDKTESGSYADEYVNHFLEDEPSPGIDYEYKLLQELLPGISAADVTAAARDMFADRSRVVLGDITAERRADRADRERSAHGTRKGGRGCASRPGTTRRAPAS